MISRLLPRSLTTQLILIAVLALLTAQAIVFPLFFYARLSSVAAVIQESALARFVGTAQLLQSTPQDLHDTVLASIGSHPSKVQLTDRLDQLPAEPPLPLSIELSRLLSERGGSALSQARVYAEAVPSPNKPMVAIYARLASGQYLWMQLQIPDPLPTWAAAAIPTATALSLLMAAAMVLILRRLTRPLADLTQAAEALGRGQQLAPLREYGPEDVQKTLRAFNRMQLRIRDHIDERTRMLASVSHDLRTPLTALRLQAEFIADPAQRDSLLRTLGEMDAVTESALSYLKNSRSSEPSRSVDMAALVDSAVEELRLIGFDVSFDYAGRLPCQCRPSLMKRALSNLIRNAAQYGHCARIALHSDADNLQIQIDDDGPGIPEADYEQVLKPFQRLETSRNRDTGGSGLGLAIANDIILSHGGSLRFAPRPEGGFRQTVTLPRE